MVSGAAGAAEPVTLLQYQQRRRILHPNLVPVYTTKGVVRRCLYQTFCQSLKEEKSVAAFQHHDRLAARNAAAYSRGWFRYRCHVMDLPQHAEGRVGFLPGAFL